jgi:hypothetical protein
MNARLKTGEVLGPLGYPLTAACLPAPTTQRWTVFRKAEVVAALNGGLLSTDEACGRYQLTLEELSAWRRAVAKGGVSALRTTKSQSSMRSQHMTGSGAQDATWFG